MKFVSVRALGGSVLLSGTVFSVDQKNAAATVASQTPGAVKIVNMLRVKPVEPK